jgi:hypothetical protein
MSNHPPTWRHTAVAAALFAISAAPSHAVSVSPNGLGQVLLYPYYSAQSFAGSAKNAIVAMTNTTTTAKALAVRFFEAKAGAEVLGFHVYLAANQTWAAAVIPLPSGAAGIVTASVACAVPSIPFTSPVSFVNFAYAGDGLGDGLERTREGHIEVIEMATYAANSQTAIAVTPVNGVASCAVNETTAGSEAQAPTGGLMGYAEIVDVAQGYTFSAVPTVLDAFSATSLFNSPASGHPNLADVNPPSATVTSFGLTSAGDFARPVDAVSTVLMHYQVRNEFTDTIYGSATDWVLTFPTKPFYYVSGTPVALFQRALTSGGACDDIEFVVNQVPSGTVNGSLCSATNVVSFNNANLLSSANVLAVGTQETGGWAAIQPAQFATLPSVHKLTATGAIFYSVPAGTTTSGAATFYGLPMIGFAARKASSGFVAIPDGEFFSTEADTAPHKYLDSQSSP